LILLGLGSCTKINSEQIKLLEMDKGRIMLTEYWTNVPPKKQFEEKTQMLLNKARERKTGFKNEITSKSIQMISASRKISSGRRKKRVGYF
jgi:hypothetical protein